MNKEQKMYELFEAYMKLTEAEKDRYIQSLRESGLHKIADAFIMAEEADH